MGIVKILHLEGIQYYINIWLVNRVFVGTSPRWFGVKRWLLNQLRTINIGENTKVVGPLFCTGKLSIGDNCWVGKNFTVNGNGSVEISDNCDIAPEVVINTGGHKVGCASRRAGEGIATHVKIGKGCWLCARSTIVNNVTIGDGCVVLPCSCVIGDVPSNAMVGGVPAKVVKML